MRRKLRGIVLAGLTMICAAAGAQDARQIVQQAVQTELAADAADHSHWIFFDVDNKPNAKVAQWVAEAAQGDLDRIMQQNGKALTPQEQRQQMASFAQNPGAQAKQRKNNLHDDQESRQMLKLLPEAFIWSKAGTQPGKIILHFGPAPRFHAPSYQARVFAAMEGEMTVDSAQHRIASLKGHMIHDVKFGEGLLGDMKAGGSFDVERRETGHGIWQITETHVHVTGRELLFKNISDEEDETRSKFKQIGDNLSFGDAEKLLMAQHD